MSEGAAEQLSGAELRRMAPEAIVTARREGRLSELLAGRDPGAYEEGEQRFKPPEGADQGARGKTYGSPGDWLRSLPPEQVVELRKAGLLDDILGGHGSQP
jgi:hypothetical protein